MAMKRSMTHITALMAVLAGSLFTAAAAQTAPFPQSTVRFIVAIPAGGVGDAVIRIAAQYLQTQWKVPVIVDNRPGGNGAIAAQAAARATADGTTLLVIQDAAFTSSPFLSEKPLSYSIDELTPIMPLVEVTPVLAVNASLPVSSIGELIQLSKSKPGSLAYGSFGVGTYSHLSMEDFKLRAGIDALHVPYRGSASAVADLVSGQLSLILASISTVEEHSKSGSLRLIAAATRERLPNYPDLPTVAEAGFPGFETSAWFGLFGPVNLSLDLVETIHLDVSRSLSTPTAREYFRVNSVRRREMSSAQFRELIDKDSQHWARLIKTLGVTVQ
jgi:tripartite-type tricarboxylate transporter receptor subunit TctC